MTFEGQAPTGHGCPTAHSDTVELEEIRPAAVTIYVGSAAVRLVARFVDALGEPHPEQQGFHIKLTVDVPGGTHSTAFSKHKVFWVKCAPSPSAERIADKPKPEAFALRRRRRCPLRCPQVPMGPAVAVRRLDSWV